jgi:hypothetical protein
MYSLLIVDNRGSKCPRTGIEKSRIETPSVNKKGILKNVYE